MNPIIQEYKDKGIKLRPNWEEVKEDVMREVLITKFALDMHCRELLLSTGHKKLIEHTTRDSYWGNGGDDSGLNRLGYLLEEERSYLN